jgi:hypothetical protein
MDFGHEIGRRFIGSLVALFGFAVGFLIILWLTLKPRRTRRQHHRHLTALPLL